MKNLHTLNEFIISGFNYELLDIISYISILCGVLVIISKNPVVSVLYLIGLFITIASYLMMLGINFIGLSYLLVYVGAVSILFLFILMLINVRISELVTDNNNSIPLAINIGVIFSLVLYKLLPLNFSFVSSKGSAPNKYVNNIDLFQSNSEEYVNNNLNSLLYNSNDLLFVSSQTWDKALAEISHISTVGNVIYTVYPLWLILTSIILLLAMVGAIVITIKQ